MYFLSNKYYFSGNSHVYIWSIKHSFLFFTHNQYEYLDINISPEPLNG
ncbi:hypothetical protein HMPREF0693_1063 [Proteus mirabilis ATCC 29906]|nr:hypothetical protein HMPREF0693_1063 [Proteus mirabilis ATCC 29906]KXC00166.1 hypothetical protein HMPREF3203_02329 [Proteus mirabilis]PVF84283.1 hypothetical protein CSC14_3749 [Proteus mirabilis]